MALLNEIVGRSRWAPAVFGSQAPDSGNAEILALFGTDAQKQRYLNRFLNGEISSCYSMTEPQGGSDPGLFTTTAVRDGDDWVINGEKWFSSNACYASFYIVMAVTNPRLERTRRCPCSSCRPKRRASRSCATSGVGGESSGARIARLHPLHRCPGARRPRPRRRGQAFAIAQTRLGGGRVHHAMRTIALARKAFDMM